MMKMLSVFQAAPAHSLIFEIQTFQEKTVKQISEAHEALKKIGSRLETIAELGEQALKTGEGPAAIQIASQASCLSHLADITPSPQE